MIKIGQIGIGHNHGGFGRGCGVKYYDNKGEKYE